MVLYDVRLVESEDMQPQTWRANCEVIHGVLTVWVGTSNPCADQESTVYICYHVCFIYVYVNHICFIYVCMKKGFLMFKQTVL